MKKELQRTVFEAINQKYPEAKVKIEDIEMSYPPEGMGDYSCNVAMKLVKVLGKNPKEIGEEIVELLNDSIIKTKTSLNPPLRKGEDSMTSPELSLEKWEENANPPQLSFSKRGNIKKIEVAGAGFLNFFLKDEYFQSLAFKINKEGREYGQLESEGKEKIILEFVSANPTGPIHLGNGRGAPYGDTLAKILEKSGQEVWREYYVNDFGNQIKVLGHSVLKDDEAEYKGEYIEKLNKENNLADAFAVGQWAASKIIEEIIKPSMEKLGVKFDGYFSEKSLHKEGKVEEAFAILKGKDLIYEKDGALWFKAKKFGDEKDRVIKKSTGEITYFGSDIANHKNKFDRGFDRAINIWGADHHGDVKRVLGAVKVLGYENKVEIILTQMVRVIKDGKEYKMSKRKGTYISVDDLIEEVGKDAVRFFFLMYSNNTHINFDINLAKERSEKNPVFYVQYAHARICSILNKFQITKNKFQTVPTGRQANSKSEIQNPKLLVHEKELSLLKHLNKFPELIGDMADWRETHHLPAYLIQLADKFHSFYSDCQVVDEKNPELSIARIELVKAVKVVLAEGLDLMGVETPEKM